MKKNLVADQSAILSQNLHPITKDLQILQGYICITQLLLNSLKKQKNRQLSDVRHLKFNSPQNG